MNYQDQTKQYRLSTYSPEACVLGLLAEAGEVAGVFQKLMRGDYTPQEAMARLYRELGDVLWHIAEVASDNGWSLEEIMKDNIDKLESRRLRNVITGSGDHR